MNFQVDLTSVGATSLVVVCDYYRFFFFFFFSLWLLALAVVRCLNYDELNFVSDTDIQRDIFLVEKFIQRDIIFS